MENNFTGQTIPQFHNSNNLKNNESNKINSYQNQTRNLDSSLQQRTTFSQSICTCGKWKTDTNNTYKTIKSLTRLNVVNVMKVKRVLSDILVTKENK